MNRLFRIFLILPFCPTLFAMNTLTKRDYAATLHTVTLETTDNESFSLDRSLAESFVTLKNCMLITSDGKNSKQHAFMTNQSIPIDLDSRTLALLLNIYASGNPSYTSLREYNFDNFLSILTAAEYLEIPSSVKDQIVKRIALSATRDEFTARGQSAGATPPLYKHWGFYLANLGMLAIACMNHLDKPIAFEHWIQFAFKILMVDIILISLDLYVTKRNHISRLESETVKTVGEGFLHTTYFDNDTISKIGQARLHNRTKCDLIIPCIGSNKILRAIITNQPITNQMLMDETRSLWILDQERAQRLVKNAEDMHNLLKEAFGNTCMRELSQRLVNTATTTVT